MRVLLPVLTSYTTTILLLKRRSQAYQPSARLDSHLTGVSAAVPSLRPVPGRGAAAAVLVMPPSPALATVAPSSLLFSVPGGLEYWSDVLENVPGVCRDYTGFCDGGHPVEVQRAQHRVSGSVTPVDAPGGVSL